MSTTAQRLHDFILSHDGIEIESHTDSTVTLTAWESCNGEYRRSAPETVEANLQAVKEWLGY